MQNDCGGLLSLLIQIFIQATQNCRLYESEVNEILFCIKVMMALLMSHLCVMISIASGHKQFPFLLVKGKCTMMADIMDLSKENYSNSREQYSCIFS